MKARFLLATLSLLCAAAARAQSPAPPFAVDLVYSGGAPSLVLLDSGVVYRIITSDSVSLTPRLLHLAPVWIAPLVMPRSDGVAFIPRFTGWYRLDAPSERTVRIYQEERDRVLVECLRDPALPRCEDARGSSRYGRFIAAGTTIILLGIFGLTR